MRQQAIAAVKNVRLAVPPDRNRRDDIGNELEIQFGQGDFGRLLEALYQNRCVRVYAVTEVCRAVRDVNSLTLGISMPEPMRSSSVRDT